MVAKQRLIPPNSVSQRCVNFLGVAISQRFMLTDIYRTDSYANTLRFSDLPDDLIGTVACFFDTRTTCALNSTSTQFRKFFGKVKLTKEASERLMFESEFRERIQARLVSPVGNIHIRVDFSSLTETLIAALKNVETLA